MRKIASRHRLAAAGLPGVEHLDVHVGAARDEPDEAWHVAAVAVRLQRGAESGQDRD